MSPTPPRPRPANGRRGRPNDARSSRTSSPRGSTYEGIGGDQVEGRQAVLELLRARRRNVKKIFMAENLESATILDDIEREAQRQHIPVNLVSHARLDREANTEGHQGVLAFADRLNTVSIESLMNDPRAFLIVCDGVTDPRNLGAILRSADGAGVTGVILPRHRSARISPAVTKTAAGAIEYMAFCDVGGIPTALDQLNRSGVMTVGLDGEATNSLFQLDLSTGPVALVIGSEQSGLSTLTKKRCSVLAGIPQRGKISSLNASVAGSVAAFEIARQRS